MLKVTTSWDDGDILDKRLVRLLDHYGIKGTFYVSKDYCKESLSEKDLRQISQRHEIGAHTITHTDLRTLDIKKMEYEIRESKIWLEQILGIDIKMFCYPSGFYNASATSIVKENNFLGARTTKIGSINYLPDPYLMETTIQVYPFPFRKLSNKKYYWGKLLQPYKQRAPKLRALGVPGQSMYSWLSMAKAVFDVTLLRGEVFHLWGHSWEINKYGMWDELEKFLQYIGDRKDCTYLTNSELLKQSK